MTNKLAKVIVYKTTNCINGKTYIGVHRCSNKDGSYIRCGISRKDKKPKVNKGFPAAVHKYGYENFKREMLFEYEDTENGRQLAYDKEKELVTQEFVERTDTYNLITGGKNATYPHNKPIRQYTLTGKLIKEWSSIEEALSTLSLTSIAACLSKKAKYAGGFLWRYASENLEELKPVNVREKTVYLFDLAGNLIKVWKCAGLAATLFTNINTAKSAINQTCMGKKNHAYGYYWSYTKDFNFQPNNVDPPVAKYTDTGDFVEAYDSITEAAKLNNIENIFNIKNAIRGKQKRCNGWRWRYFYGNKSNIKPLVKDKDIV